MRTSVSIECIVPVINFTIIINNCCRFNLAAVGKSGAAGVALSLQERLTAKCWQTRQNVDFWRVFGLLALVLPRNSTPRWLAKDSDFLENPKTSSSGDVHMSQEVQRLFPKSRWTSEWRNVLQSIQKPKKLCCWLFETQLFIDFWGGKRRALGVEKNWLELPHVLMTRLGPSIRIMDGGPQKLL